MELALLIGVVLFFAIRGILGERKLFELPTIYALLFIAFIIPQALSVERSFVGAAFDAWYLWLYMTLCFVVASLGFWFGKSKAVTHANLGHVGIVHEQRVMAGAVVLAVLGFISSSRVGSIAASSDLGSQWTGVATFWYLLIQTTFFALAISTLRFLKNPHIVYLVVGGITLVAVLIMFGQNVKRHMIAEVAIIIAGAWFFTQGKQPPKLAVLAACFLGIVLVHQVGAVRQFIKDDRGNAFDAFVQGVPFERFEYFNDTRAREVTQAVVDLHVANLKGELEGPVPLWNNLVHQYFPAFIFGVDAKRALKFESNTTVNEDLEYSQYSSIGSTRTGFSDTYRSYSVFGCLVFFLLGALMGYLYGFAVKGVFWAQFYYLVLLNDSMIAVTESTSRFVSILPFVFIVTWWFVRPSGSSGVVRSQHTASQEIEIARP